MITASFILDPVLSPLLKIPVLYSITLISFIISLVTMLIYKFATDQNLMKQLRSELKELQNEMKQLKDKPKEAMKVQARFMETNMKYMMQSMKPMIFTLLPALVIFGWMGSHFAYASLQPNTEFRLTAHFSPGTSGEAALTVLPGSEAMEIMGPEKEEIRHETAVWKLKAPPGRYSVDVQYSEEHIYKDILVSEKWEYEPPVEKSKDNTALKSAELSNEKIHPVEIGGFRVGWLGTYIITTLVFSMLLRKILNVY